MCTAEFLDEQQQNEEREIEYLVRDEIGALASTLQKISVSISDSSLIILCMTLYITLFFFHEKDLGINISGINLHHLPSYIVDNRTTKHGLKINFIECSN